MRRVMRGVAGVVTRDVSDCKTKKFAQLGQLKMAVCHFSDANMVYL